MKARHYILIILPVMLMAAFTFQDEFIDTLQQKLKTYYQQNIPGEASPVLRISPSVLPAIRRIHKVFFFVGAG